MNNESFVVMFIQWLNLKLVEHFMTYKELLKI